MDAHVHLIKETDCHNIICIPTTRSLAEGITTNLHQSESSTYSISTTIAPEVADLLPLGKEAADDDSSSHYPYNKTWDEACNDPCLIVHTSGSTGMPKVIYYTQRMLANPATQSLLPSVEGRLPLLREWQGCRLLTTVPPFHVSDFFCSTVFSQPHNSGRCILKVKSNRLAVTGLRWLSRLPHLYQCSGSDGTPR